MARQPARRPPSPSPSPSPSPARQRAMARMQREMKLRPMVEEPGYCNAPLPGTQHQLCRRRAGMGTDHPGVGPCRWHDSRPPEEGEARYRAFIQDTSLRDHLKSAARWDRDLTNLEPEVQLVRALLLRHLNEYETLHDAFLDWAAHTHRRVPPKAIPDISQVINIIDRLSVLVERIHKMRQKSSIDMATLRRVMESMGVIVARHVTDTRALEAIEIEWSNLTLNSKTGQRAPWDMRHQDQRPALPPAPVVDDEEEYEEEEETE